MAHFLYSTNKSLGSLSLSYCHTYGVSTAFLWRSDFFSKRHQIAVDFTFFYENATCWRFHDVFTAFMAMPRRLHGELVATSQRLVTIRRRSRGVPTTL
jgi:hypothetical protein